MDKILPKPESRFLFLGNQLALDFVNTKPVQNGVAQELLPDFSAVLDWFQAAGVLDTSEVSALRRNWHDSKKTHAALTALLEFRELLREEVVHWERTGKLHIHTLRIVNELLAKHPMLTRVQVHGIAPHIEHWFSPTEPLDLLAPLARSAAELFAEADWKRVRKCEVCVLHYLDISKKGSRRWCSMQFCGNRAKVAAYAARQRKRG